MLWEVGCSLLDLALLGLRAHVETWMCAIDILGKRKGFIMTTFLIVLCYLCYESLRLWLTCLLLVPVTTILMYGCGQEALPGSHLFEKEMLDFQRAAWCG